MRRAWRERRKGMAWRAIEDIEPLLAGERPLDVLDPETGGEAPRRDERIG